MKEKVYPKLLFFAEDLLEFYQGLLEVSWSQMWDPVMLLTL